ERVLGVADEIEVIYVQGAPIHLRTRYYKRSLLDSATTPDVLGLGFNLYHHLGRRVVSPRTLVTVELSAMDLSSLYFNPEPSPECQDMVTCSSLAVTLSSAESDRQ